MSKLRCGRKAMYSKKEAQELAMRRSAEHGRGGYAYRCDNCDWWHISKGELPEDKEWRRQFRARLGLKP